MTYPPLPSLSVDEAYARDGRCYIRESKKKFPPVPNVFVSRGSLHAWQRSHEAMNARDSQRKRYCNK